MFMRYEQQLSMREVIKITGLSRSSINRRIKEGSFPKPHSDGNRRKWWFASDIDAYQAACKAGKKYSAVQADVIEQFSSPTVEPTIAKINGGVGPRDS